MPLLETGNTLDSDAVIRPEGLCEKYEGSGMHLFLLHSCRKTIWNLLFVTGLVDGASGTQTAGREQPSNRLQL